MTSLLWTVRRELWENRSIYIAPLAVAVFFIFGFSLSTIGMPARRRVVLTLPEPQQVARIAEPYDVVATMMIGVAFIIGIVYCLDALYGERRDRSILFWKSLPVSDITTVIAKAIVPLVVIPAVIFVVIVVTHFVMLLITSAVLFQSGLAGTTWSRFRIVEESFLLLYGLVALALWHAPLYGWLLVVSAWAKRATFVWAFVPPFAIAAVEKLAFNTTWVLKFVQYRLIGHVALAFQFDKKLGLHSISQLTPGKFLTTPGLWIGLLVAAGLIATAIRLRRNREPI